MRVHMHLPPQPASPTAPPKPAAENWPAFATEEELADVIARREAQQRRQSRKQPRDQRQAGDQDVETREGAGELKTRAAGGRLDFLA